ncbi:MAG: hypothetical protein HKP62_06135, partial [Sulfurovum sp.]|nr:HK97 family phage prohead protease [Sulfurovum sp.]NNJ45574.1 hypothetical protein [Sulfurovum sp.]
MSNKQFSVISDFKVKEVSEEDNAIIIEGYANTTSADRVGDVVLQEAWSKGGMLNYLSNPIVLAFHDHSKPIGNVIEHSVDSNGLRVVAKVFKAAGNTYEFVKQGILRTFSVSFQVKDADYEQDKDLFYIKDLELLEISVVSVPANAGSVFSVRKSFDTEDDYTGFKEEFNKQMAENTETETEQEVKTSETASTEEILKALEEKLATSLETQNEKLTALLEKQIEKEKENMSDTKDETVQPTVEFGQDMVEKLLKEAEARIKATVEDDKKTLNDALAGLRGELEEKSAELAALQRNKMSFEDRETVRASREEVDSAILLSKAMGRRIEDTKFGKQLIEKAGVSPHLGSTTETWEEEFSMRLESDIRETLIMEPMFRTIAMNAPTMHIPVNPEAAYGEFIARTYPPLRSADGASTGTAQDHEIIDTVLTAHKLVSKEYLGDEEEEDSILPLMPLVRDAVMRRMAKASDRALLRGDAAQATGDGDTYPFNGVATVGVDATNITTLSIGGAEKVTVQTLATARRDLGIWGMNPSDLVYVVSQDAYYDLLDDTDFRTQDLVGNSATILRGQIGMA